jgi:Nucleotidyl transferase AbiEii toxin, Type IV TA system
MPIMTFNNKHHQNILKVLNSLNSELLEDTLAYFGGGTVISLDNNEFRFSNDIDFICSVNSDGYKRLRNYIYDNGVHSLFKNNSEIIVMNDLRDQYGIRFVSCGVDFKIKTEIIAEVRFILDSPRYLKESSVPCLSVSDCFTSKLLANSDRFLDTSVKSRDLIDLCFLRLKSEIPNRAIKKAEEAYEVIRPLKRAISNFQNKPEFRNKCYGALGITDDVIPLIIDGLDLLAIDYDLSKTKREFKEQQFFSDDES